MGNKFGQIVDTTFSGGLSVKEFWVQILEVNEKYWRDTPEFVLTDEEIQALVLKAFPSRTWSRSLGSAVRYRASYNRGRLIPGSKPAGTSYRYTREVGRVVRREARKSRSQRDSKPCNSCSSSVQVCHILMGVAPKSVGCKV